MKPGGTACGALSLPAQRNRRGYNDAMSGRVRILASLALLLIGLAIVLDLLGWPPIVRAWGEEDQRAVYVKSNSGFRWIFIHRSPKMRLGPDGLEKVDAGD